jgi:hypothetical protein
MTETEKCMKAKRIRIAAAGLLLATALEGIAATASAAFADDGWPQAYVWATDVRVHNNPDTSSADIVGTVSQSWVPARCQKPGPNVTDGNSSSNWWTYVEIPDGHDTMGWINNVFITGPAKPSWIPVCDS